MKKLFEKWDGVFIIEGKEKKDLKDWHPKKGEKFNIILTLGERRTK